MKSMRLTTIRNLGILIFSSIVFFACSKDEPIENLQPQQLMLTASSNSITEGETITFSVTAKGESVNADIFINGSKINDNTHVFKEKGTYSVVAKKEGYKNSSNLEITVKKIIVHLVGSKTDDSGERVAVYWKNGHETLLPDGSTRSFANSITTTNGDIYIYREKCTIRLVILLLPIGKMEYALNSLMGLTLLTGMT